MAFALESSCWAGGSNCRKSRLVSLGIPGILALLGITGHAIAEDLSDAGSHSTAPSSTVFNLLDDRWLLSVGASRLRGEATVGASIDGLPPAEISLNDLGLEERDTSYFSDLTYRINERWDVQVSLYSFDVSSSGMAERDFSFGGTDFTVGAELDLGLDVDAYLLHASYRVYDGNRFDLQLGGGIHALDLGTSIRGALSVGENEVSGQQSSSSLLAPVPNLRAEARWHIADRLAVTGTTGWLSANVGDYEGDFIYLHLQTVYSITEQLGVALGYQRTAVDVTESRSRSQIVYDVVLDGATLTLKYAF
ncbi:MAG: hypothetical protein AAFY29_20930 [Pseudomonadota bacterium]